MEIFYSIRLNILNLFFVMDPILESIVNVISTLMKNSTEFFIMMLRLLKELLLLPCGTPIDFGKSSAAQHMKKRLDSIRETPYMALRLGKVTWQNDWILSNDVITDLMNGKRDITSLCDHDFQPNIQQKIVDMKIGLDISTITYKKFASRIVLIAGDSDFVPAAKLARMEGIHVTIDPMGKRLTPDLIEHVDFVHTELDPDNSQDVDPSRKNFFVKNFKED